MSEMVADSLTKEKTENKDLDENKFMEIIPRRNTSAFTTTALAP